MFFNNLNKFFSEIHNSQDLDEWYLSKFIDDNIACLSEEMAFQELNIVLNRIQENLHSEFLYELLEIAVALQIKSNTYEKPAMLLEYPNIFNDIKSNYEEGFILVPTYKLSSIYFPNLSRLITP